MNIFERALNMANDCMDVMFGELFTPVEEDREELLARMKTAMLQGKQLTLNGTNVVQRYGDHVADTYEDLLNAVAKNMGELV